MTVPLEKMPQIDNVYQILGLKDIAQRSPLQQEYSQKEIVNLIRQGFPPSTAEQVAEYSGFSKAKIATLLHTSERTLSRRKKENKPLDPTESDRLYRLARIIARTLEVFEDASAAKNWLKRPNRALAGVVPFELLDTDAGTQQVMEVLARIEYGVYS